MALEQVPHPQSAIFTADHTTGYVVAMAGGTDFTRSVYNRTVQACRQPGSTYKPIYYSAAIDAGYGYDTILHDIPKKEVDPITGQVWIPTNFDGSVDQHDLDAWMSAPSSEAANGQAALQTPEPSAAVLTLTTLAGLLKTRHSRCTSQAPAPEVR